jgi:Domain of unknown function (DUF4145)
MAGNKIVQRCGHCGNVTAFSMAALGIQPNVIASQERETTIWTTWRVLLCSTCAQPTFERDVQEVKGPLSSTPPVRSTSPEVLYPVERIARWRHVPLSILEMYQEAMNVEKVSPRACALMAGLALEEICRVERAKGTTLAERLTALALSGRIPTMLVEMAHQLRQFRNIGAHAVDEKITEEDVPILLYFVEAILEYLYVAPATIAAVERRLAAKSEALPRTEQIDV